jgi:sodium transport system permease protein
MKLRNVGIVYRKELIDQLRDRRTVISMVVIPILLFPLLTIGFAALAMRLVQRAQQEGHTVMVLGGEHAPALVEALREIENIRLVDPAPDYAARITEKKLRLAVDIPEGFEQSLQNPGAEKPVVKIYHFAGELRSQLARRAVEEALRKYREAVVEQRLAARNLSSDVLKPFESKEENVAPPEKVGGTQLGGFIPYFIIILTLTGAMYPAMDLTAGEKERGTIETILASPVNRAHLVLGKFFLVVSFSAITALLSIVSFLITLLGGAQLFSRLTSSLVIAVSGKAAAAVFLLVLPLAVLFSAALMAIAIYARNYREAQTYIGPLMLVVILPAMASFIPGVQLDARFALVPILNVSLAAKEIFGGTYPWPLLGLILGSTTAYAGAALFFAVRQFHREDVLFRT